MGWSCPRPGLFHLQTPPQSSHQIWCHMERDKGKRSFTFQPQSMKCVWFNTDLSKQLPMPEALTRIYGSSHTCSNVSCFHLSAAHSLSLGGKGSVGSEALLKRKVNSKVLKELSMGSTLALRFHLLFILTTDPHEFYKPHLFAIQLSPFSLLFPVLQ